jgi:hypothetical protein
VQILESQQGKVTRMDTMPASVDAPSEEEGAAKTTKNLVRDPWFENYQIGSQGWGTNGFLRYFDFDRGKGTSLSYWKTDAAIGSRRYPITLYTQNPDATYGQMTLPMGAPKGANVVDLNGLGTQGFVEQEVRTRKGGVYLLSYWLGYDMFSGTSGAAFARMGAQVSAVDAETGLTLVAKTSQVAQGGKAPNRVNNDPQWRQERVEFTARSALTRIRVQDMTGPLMATPDIVPASVGNTGGDITGVFVTEKAPDPGDLKASFQPVKHLKARAGSKGTVAVDITNTGKARIRGQKITMTPGPKGVSFLDPQYVSVDDRKGKKTTHTCTVTGGGATAKAVCNSVPLDIDPKQTVRLETEVWFADGLQPGEMPRVNFVIGTLGETFGEAEIVK